MAAPHVAAANRYARDVVAGRIAAGKWVRLACKRHLDDLERAKTNKAFPYYFDIAAGERVCRFAELLPHVKGKWARAKELLVLGAWQCFILVVLFGWKRRKNHLRRFREAYIKIPRKNGKSVLAAVIGLYMLLMDGEAGPEVYSGATSEKQAWEVFRPAKQMLERSPHLMEWAGAEVWAKSLVVPLDGGRFEPIIGKPGDGSSPSCAIADEFHEHDTPDLVDTMQTGMGAREQPLLLEITTAGYNLAGPCYDKELAAGKVLEGTVDDPELFAIMFGIDETDDWTDPRSLRKANPNFGVSVDEDFLLAQQRQAVLNPTYATRFKTKHLNVWTSARDALVNMVPWNLSADPQLTPEELAGEDCVFAIDLASKSDLCAVAKVFRRMLNGKPHYYVFVRYYLPEETVERDAKNAANYRKWVLSGHLVQTEGATTDFDLVTEDLVEDMKRYNPTEEVFDPFNATWMAQKIMEEGGNAVEFPQTAKNMAPATDEFLSAVNDYRVHHDGNPITTWCVSNLVARKGGGKLPVPTKEKPHSKIDGAVAIIMGIGRAMAGETNEESVYEQMAREA